MSYNVDSVDERVLDAWMEAETILEFLEEHDSDLAENNFLWELENAASTAVEEGAPQRLIPLESFSWTGTWSGRGMDFLKKKIIPKIKGRVEAIFIWEGGDSMEGIAIRDGKFVDCGVKLELIKPEGW